MINKKTIDAYVERKQEYKDSKDRLLHEALDEKEKEIADKLIQHMNIEPSKLKQVLDDYLDKQCCKDEIDTITIDDEDEDEIIEEEDEEVDMDEIINDLENDALFTEDEIYNAAETVDDNEYVNKLKKEIMRLEKQLDDGDKSSSLLIEMVNKLQDEVSELKGEKIDIHHLSIDEQLAKLKNPTEADKLKDSTKKVLNKMFAPILKENLEIPFFARIIQLQKDNKYYPQWKGKSIISDWSFFYNPTGKILGSSFTEEGALLWLKKYCTRLEFVVKKTIINCEDLK